MKLTLSLIVSLAVLQFCNYKPTSNTSSGESDDPISGFVLPSGVEVKIVEAPFVASLFKVDGCSDQDSKCRINDSIPFGVAFGLPKSYVKSITASFGGGSHSLDVSKMFNAWGSRPLEVKGVIRYFGGRCRDAQNCQLRGVFSDAGGTFVAEWSVIDGRTIRTVITDSNDVVNLFMEHIDPSALGRNDPPLLCRNDPPGKLS